MIRRYLPPIVIEGPAHAVPPTRVCPSLLEPARVQPDYEMQDDMGAYAEAHGREALEGGLWLPLEAS